MYSSCYLKFMLLVFQHALLEHCCYTSDDVSSTCDSTKTAYLIVSDNRIVENKVIKSDCGLFNLCYLTFEDLTANTALETHSASLGIRGGGYTVGSVSAHAVEASRAFLWIDM